MTPTDGKLNKAMGKRLIALGRRIDGNFNESHWHEVGLLTGYEDLFFGHNRLMRSLAFGDGDYFGCVLDVLDTIARKDPDEIATIEQFCDERFPAGTVYVSGRPATKTITFAPSVFSIPEVAVEDDLVAVMMPLRPDFKPVYTIIRRACERDRLRCQRADDVWEESVLVQDIFNLIFRAKVIVVDFSGKNGNVMYETGIAHTLGKTVVPITQSIDDVPFDLKHHRALLYTITQEGLGGLGRGLVERLKQFAPPPSVDLNDIPF